jgi:hypothetical protein
VGSVPQKHLEENAIIQDELVIRRSSARTYQDHELRPSIQKALAQDDDAPAEPIAISRHLQTKYLSAHM